MFKPVYIAVGLNRIYDEVFKSNRERDTYDKAMEDGEDLVRLYDEIVYFKVEKYFKEEQDV